MSRDEGQSGASSSGAGGPGAAGGARTLSPEAFGEAFAASSRLLWCIAAGVLGRRDGVEDVLQDGAMVALRKLDEFDADTSFVAWMGRIVRFVALNHARRRHRSPIAIDADALESRPGGATGVAHATTARGDVPADQGSFDDDVLHALRELEETARACLLLRSILGLPYREIARALDIPEGTAMSHMHRARRALRERLKDRAPRTVTARTDPDA